MHQIVPKRGEAGAPAAVAVPRRAGLRRLVPVVALAAGLGAFFALGLDRYLSFEALRDNRTMLMDFVASDTALAVALYIAVYAGLTALSVPGGAILTVAGGFLFGAVIGTVYVVIGATIGAVAVFLAARTAIGDLLRAKAGPALRKMEAGFQADAFSYLLVLRLVPLFPFFLVNIVPAFLGVKLRTYAVATLIGIIPGSFVFTSVGAGLGSVFDQAGGFTLEGVLTTEVVVALVGLSVLSLLPVAYRKLKRRAR
jgi:uncharacterized membrane protein YdjX (TVP38/TMEM64 family)